MVDPRLEEADGCYRRPHQESRWGLAKPIERPVESATASTADGEVSQLGVAERGPVEAEAGAGDERAAEERGDTSHAVERRDMSGEITGPPVGTERGCLGADPLEGFDEREPLVSDVTSESLWVDLRSDAGIHIGMQNAPWRAALASANGRSPGRQGIMATCRKRGASVR